MNESSNHIDEQGQNLDTLQPSKILNAEINDDDITIIQDISAQSSETMNANQQQLNRR